MDDIPDGFWKIACWVVIGVLIPAAVVYAVAAAWIMFKHG